MPSQPPHTRIEPGTLYITIIVPPYRFTRGSSNQDPNGSYPQQLPVSFSAGTYEVTTSLGYGNEEFHWGIYYHVDEGDGIWYFPVLNPATLSHGVVHRPSHEIIEDIRERSPRRVPQVVYMLQMLNIPHRTTAAEELKDYIRCVINSLGAGLGETRSYMWMFRVYSRVRRYVRTRAGIHSLDTIDATMLLTEAVECAYQSLHRSNIPRNTCPIFRSNFILDLRWSLGSWANESQLNQALLSAHRQHSRQLRNIAYETLYSSVTPTPEPRTVGELIDAYLTYGHVSVRALFENYSNNSQTQAATTQSQQPPQQSLQPQNTIESTRSFLQNRIGLSSALVSALLAPTGPNQATGLSFLASSASAQVESQKAARRSTQAAQETLPQQVPTSQFTNNQTVLNQIQHYAQSNWGEIIQHTSQQQHGHQPVSPTRNNTISQPGQTPWAAAHGLTPEEASGSVGYPPSLLLNLPSTASNINAGPASTFSHNSNNGTTGHITRPSTISALAGQIDNLSFHGQTFDDGEASSSLMASQQRGVDNMQPCRTSYGSPGDEMPTPRATGRPILPRSPGVGAISNLTQSTLDMQAAIFEPMSTSARHRISPSRGISGFLPAASQSQAPASTRAMEDTRGEDLQAPSNGATDSDTSSAYLTAPELNSPGATNATPNNNNNIEPAGGLEAQNEHESVPIVKANDDEGFPPLPSHPALAYRGWV